MAKSSKNTHNPREREAEPASLPTGMPQAERPVTNAGQAIALIRQKLGEIEVEVGLPHVVSELQGANLLRGLTYESVFNQISARLSENASHKNALATYVSRLIIDDGPRKLFVESGSTLGLIAATLSPDLHDRPDWPTVLTNNFLVLTSIEVGKVRVTGGALELKYLAFLDFAPAMRPKRQNERASVGEIIPTLRVIDARAFDRLNAAVSDVDVIYMTASDFGFLIGPLVGDRANAIFKYCLINNQARRPIRLCIAYPKLHIGQMAANKCEEHVRDRCYTVLNLGKRWRTKPLPRPAQHLHDYSVFVNPKAFLDSTLEHKDIKGQPRSAPTELGLQEQRNGNCEGHGLYGLYSSWLDAVSGLPPGTIELIIGLNSDTAASERRVLKEAIEEANRVLEDVGCPRKYGITDEGGSATRIAIGEASL